MAQRGDFYVETWASLPHGDWNFPSSIAIMGDDVYMFLLDVETTGFQGDGKYWVGEAWWPTLFKMRPEGGVELSGGTYNWNWDVDGWWNVYDVDEHIPDGWGPNTAIAYTDQSLGDYMLSDGERYLYFILDQLRCIRRFDTQTLQLKTIAGEGTNYYTSDLGSATASKSIRLGNGRASRWPGEQYYYSATIDYDNNDMYFWLEGQIGYQWPGTPEAHPGFHLVKLHLEEPFPLTVVYSQRDHPMFDPEDPESILKTGYPKSWLREINPSTGLPNSLNDDVTLYPRNSTADYLDGWVYYQTGMSGGAARFDRPVQPYLDGLPTTLRRFHVSDPTKHEVLYYEILESYGLEHNYDDPAAFSIISIYQDDGVFVADLHDRWSGAFYYGLKVGDRFHYDGPYEVLEITSTTVYLDLIQCDGSRKCIGWIGTTAYGGAFPSVRPVTNWYLKAYSRDAAPYFHQWSHTNPNPLKVVGDHRGVVGFSWWAGSAEGVTNPGGGNAQVASKGWWIDLQYLLENKPVRHNGNDPGPHYKYFLNAYPPPFPKWEDGTQLDYYRDGGEDPRGWYFWLGGIATTHNTSSVFYDKIVFAHHAPALSGYSFYWESAAVIRVASDSPTDTGSAVQISYDMAFEAPAMSAYQAQRQIGRVTDLGRITLS